MRARKRLDAMPDWLAEQPAEVPDHIWPGVQAYVWEGLPMGGFLTSLFCGELFNAAPNADHINGPRLAEIATWIVHFCPKDCYGTDAKVEAWRKLGGLEAWLLDGDDDDDDDDGDDDGDHPELQIELDEREYIERVNEEGTDGQIRAALRGLTPLRRDVLRRLYHEESPDGLRNLLDNMDGEGFVLDGRLTPLGIRMAGVLVRIERHWGVR